MDMGSVSDQSIAAAVMDLADRGIVRMEPTTVETPGFLGLGTKTEPTYRLTYGATVGQPEGTPHRWEDLHPLDQRLLSLLFTQIGDGSTLTIEQMKQYAKANASEFQSSMKGYKSAVQTEAERLGFIEKESSSKQTLAFVVVAAACSARSEAF